MRSAPVRPPDRVLGWDEIGTTRDASHVSTTADVTDRGCRNGRQGDYRRDDPGRVPSPTPLVHLHMGESAGVGLSSPGAGCA